MTLIFHKAPEIPCRTFVQSLCWGCKMKNKAEVWRCFWSASPQFWCAFSPWKQSVDLKMYVSDALSACQPFSSMPPPPKLSSSYIFHTPNPRCLSCSFFLLDSHYTRMTSSSTSVLGSKISQSVIFPFPSLSWFIWSCLSIEGLEIKLVVMHVTLVTCRLSLILWQQGNNDLAGFKTH